ncbi:MAG: hypothetical protein H0U57_06980 [Tatlockia sp.]|nr:hypothetical protein [Tatlockia sp.]
MLSKQELTKLNSNGSNLQTPKRLVDVLDPGLESATWGTKANAKWWKLLLNYDKNFRFLELCIGYDQAKKESNTQMADKYAAEIYDKIDEAYLEFAKSIEKGLAGKIIGNISLGDYLKSIGNQIHEAKLNKKHPRELMEIALIKLSILKDLSRMYEFSAIENSDREIGKIYIDLLPEGLNYEVIGMDGVLHRAVILLKDLPNFVDWKITEMKEDPSFCRIFLDFLLKAGHVVDNATLNQNRLSEVATYSPIVKAKKSQKEPQCSWQEFELNLFIPQILNFPIIEETKYFRKELGWAFLSPGPAHYSTASYQESEAIIPFFSTNGSLGYNTILGALFSGYLPVGFGVEPSKVHSNYYQKQSYWTARHDYGHCFLRVLKMKNEFPDFFNACKSIYFKLFEDKDINLIDEKTFQKDLLTLFIIVYEIGSDKVSYDLIKETLIDRAKTIEDCNNSAFIYPYSNSLEVYLQRKQMEKSLRPPLCKIEKDKLKEDISILAIIDSIDFIKTFKDLDYQFDEDINKRPWKAAPVLRQASLELLDGFNQRHPELFENQKKIELQRNAFFQPSEANFKHEKTQDALDQPTFCNLF